MWHGTLTVNTTTVLIFGSFMSKIRNQKVQGAFMALWGLKGLVFHKRTEKIVLVDFKEVNTKSRNKIRTTDRRLSKY